MIKSRKRNKKERTWQQFERAGMLILGQTHARRPSLALRQLQQVLRQVLPWIIGAFIIVGAAASWLTLDDRFYIYQAEVKGAQILSQEEIVQASGLKGLHILWARPSRVEAKLLNLLPTVKSAAVNCKLSAICTIRVVERQPLVTWKDEGKSWWIDAEGFIFPVESVEDEEWRMENGRWVIYGPLQRDDDEKGQLSEDLCAAISELELVRAEMPSELEYTPGRGLMFIDEKGWRVILGEGPGMTERILAWKHLKGYLEARNLEPRFVDVRFPNAPYYSMVNEW